MSNRPSSAPLACALAAALLALPAAAAQGTQPTPDAGSSATPSPSAPGGNASMPAENPCAATKRRRAGSGNPCAGSTRRDRAENPCSANPCAGKRRSRGNNPCAGSSR